MLQVRRRTTTLRDPLTHDMIVTLLLLALIGLPAYSAIGQEAEDAIDGGAIAGEGGKRGDAAAKGAAVGAAAGIVAGAMPKSRGRSRRGEACRSSPCDSLPRWRRPALSYPNPAPMADVLGKGNVGVVHFDAHYGGTLYMGHPIDHRGWVKRLTEEVRGGPAGLRPGDRSGRPLRGGRLASRLPLVRLELPRRSR